MRDILLGLILACVQEAINLCILEAQNGEPIEDIYKLIRERLPEKYHVTDSEIKEVLNMTFLEVYKWVGGKC